MSYKCIGLLGDSIGQGYFSDNNDGWFGKLIALLNKNNPRSYSSQNMAVAGEKTPSVLHRLYTEALNKDVDILFIAAGVNDLARRGAMDAQTDVSIEYRRKIWKTMLESASKNIEKVFVFSLMTVDESKYPKTSRIGVSMWRSNTDVKEYNAFLKEICFEFNIPFIDISKAWEKHKISDVLFDDVHPNEKGHKVITEEVYKQISGKI